MEEYIHKTQKLESRDNSKEKNVNLESIILKLGESVQKGENSIL